MTADEEVVICYAGDDYWHSNPHSRYHLMHSLHRRGYRVLWVNSLGMNMPVLRRSGALRKIGQRIRSWTRWLREAEPRFHVLTPIALPLFGNRVVAHLTDRLIEFQIRMAMRILGIRKPLVFASIPSYANVIMRMPRSHMIYYYSDKYVAHDDISAKSAIAKRDRLLFENADAVFCASKMITDELRQLRKNVHYLPHAVDFDHFTVDRQSHLPIPDEMAVIPSPRIGYYGSIAHNNDQEMVLHAASKNPALQFVLIGKVFGDYTRLEQLENVHFLGFIPYQDLPRYSSHFDVAFMNWKITDWIKHCSPLKAKEYLCAGHPVVSIPIHELESSYADLIYFASTPEEFLTQIESALREDNDDHRRARTERIRSESWDSCTTRMLSLLDAATGRNADSAS